MNFELEREMIAGTEKFILHRKTNSFRIYHFFYRFSEFI